MPGPKDFPPRSTVYSYFWEWTRYGLLDRIHHVSLVMVRKVEGREANPSAAIIDTQVVKATEKRASEGSDRIPSSETDRPTRSSRSHFDLMLRTARFDRAAFQIEVLNVSPRFSLRLEPSRTMRMPSSVSITQNVPPAL